MQGISKYLGHIVDAQGVNDDPEKMCVIGHFPTPTTVTEPQRFMGTVNQLGKFVPGLADINALLWQVLNKDSAWYRMKLSRQDSSESKKKSESEKLTSPEILAHYNPHGQTVIAAHMLQVNLFLRSTWSLGQFVST